MCSFTLLPSCREVLLNETATSFLFDLGGQLPGTHCGGSPYALIHVRTGTCRGGLELDAAVMSRPRTSLDPFLLYSASLRPIAIRSGQVNVSPSQALLRTHATDVMSITCSVIVQLIQQREHERYTHTRVQRRNALARGKEGGPSACRILLERARCEPLLTSSIRPRLLWVDVHSLTLKCFQYTQRLMLVVVVVGLL